MSGRMSFNDLQHGRFHMDVRGDNGASLEIGGDASKIPSWIPAYPGSKPEVAFSGSSDQGEGGTFTFKTPDSPQDVMKFYQDKINGLGLKTNLVANTSDGGTIAASEERRPQSERDRRRQRWANQRHRDLREKVERVRGQARSPGCILPTELLCFR